MTVTSPPMVRPDHRDAALRAYALHRMEIGPEDLTLHYGERALTLGATADEVVAAMHRYLGTAWLALRADEVVLDVEIDAADASIHVERLADQVCASIRGCGMSVNVDLLRRTLAHIEQSPVGWDQGDWRCDTGMCFAGWAATLAGGEWATRADSVFSNLLKPEAEDYDSPVVEVVPGEDYSLPDPAVVRVSERAQRLLGITEKQRLRLFDGSNTLDDLRRIVGELCDGAA